MRLYVLDEGGEMVPEGVKGELYIGGKGVGRGYLNRAELTEERYQEIRYEKEGKVYRTGDLVRWMGGELEYIGRRDNQVKVRGYRIELGEVEEVLKKMEGVKEAVVIVKEEKGGEKQMVAYLEGEGELRVNEIRGYLKKEIPEYMIPVGYVRVEKMPKTLSGKIDRKKMEKEEGGKLEWEREYEEPGTEKEREIARVWEEVMGIERVGVRDNFFELGGDSILTIQVIAKAKRAGLRITPRQMFEAQTVRELAGIAEEIGEEGEEEEEEQGEVRGEYPLTPIQRRFFEQEIEERWHWNQAMMMEVKERLEEEKLKEAVKELMKQHDGLRQRFRRDEEGEWKGEIVGMEGWEGVVWVEEMRGEGREEKRKEKVEEAQRSLNLEEGPLVRVVYFDHGEEEKGRLLVVIHHLVVDGVSWRILLEDLQMIYQQLKDGQPVELQKKTTSYKKWADLLFDHIKNDDLQNDLIFWRECSLIPTGVIPVDYPDGENLVDTQFSLRTSIDQEETKTLIHESIGKLGIDVQDILIYCLVKVLSTWIGYPAIALDLESHGRENIYDKVDITRTVGWFTSVFPVKIQTSQKLNISEEVTSIKEQLRNTSARGLSYGILKDLGKDELLTQIPNVGISFNYLGRITTGDPKNTGSLFKLINEPVGESQSLKARRYYLLDTIASIVDDKLLLDWRFSLNIHRKETISRLFDQFIQNIHEMAKFLRSENFSNYSPSDFRNISLSQNDINEILKEITDTMDQDIFGLDE